MVTSRETQPFYEDAFTHLCRQQPRQGSPGLSQLLWCYETLGLYQSRDKRDPSLPRKGKGPEGEAAPSAQGFLQSHLDATGLHGTRGHAAGALQGAPDLLHLTGSSSALAATSPEGEACFCLDSAAFLLCPGTITAPLAPKPCKFTHMQRGGSHLPAEQLKQGTLRLPQPHTPPQNDLPVR